MSSIKKQLRTVLDKPASRWRRFLAEAAFDLTLVIVAFAATMLLLDEFVDWPSFLFQLLSRGLPLALLSAGLLLWRGLYRIDARYIGLHDFLNIGLVAAAATAALYGLDRLFQPEIAGHYSLARPVLFGYFCAWLLAGARIVRRVRGWNRRPDGKRRDASSHHTLIVGAGDAGEMIIREITRSRFSGHTVVGFVDDHPEKLSMRIHGVKVLGTSDDIPKIVEKLDVQEVIVAIPSAAGPKLRRIIDRCGETTARVRILPAIDEVLRGSPNLRRHLRDVEIEDLLRREPVKTDLRSVAHYVVGESVLITGAGGSIGSELARQISQIPPARLILLGRGENSIYEIEQELLQTGLFRPSTVICDVRNRQNMESVFKEHRPTAVFHAAAHKHVPLMEANPLEAIRNNIYGTWLTAELSIKYAVKNFILVSTDKAVHPSSIMGATKRVGEMIVSALGQRSEVDFAIVRFGNVLGSRGSLIPMLKLQIKHGGPVRITHPEMTRFFMTIPEAVQLIVQAGSLGRRGEIFILDMGEPMKIVDLAKDLIRLHGLKPGEDIQLQYTGVRPGEKLHEQLSYSQEELIETDYAKINMILSPKLDWDLLRSKIEALLSLCDEGNEELARQLLMDLAWGRAFGPFATEADPKQAMSQP